MDKVDLKVDEIAIDSMLRRGVKVELKRVVLR
jgi:hypothetical protein